MAQVNATRDGMMIDTRRAAVTEISRTFKVRPRIIRSPHGHSRSRTQGVRVGVGVGTSMVVIIMSGSKGGKKIGGTKTKATAAAKSIVCGSVIYRKGYGFRTCLEPFDLRFVFVSFYFVCFYVLFCFGFCFFSWCFFWSLSD